MNLDSAIDKVKSLTDKQKKNWFFQLERLITQFHLGVALHRPYRLLLDTNILLRMEEAARGNFNEGNLAILTFFHYLHKQSEWTADVIIRPPVLFEFWRRSNAASLKDYWPKFREVDDLIQETLNVQPLFEGVETFEQANHHIAQIISDEIILQKELIAIEEKDWHVNFTWRWGDGIAGVAGKNGLVHAWPSSVAEKFAASPKLDYFNEWIVRQVLINHITFKIYENRKNDKATLKEYRSSEDFSLKNFFRLQGEKRKLQGLADLDLFSIGNIQHQFNNQAHRRYFPATIPLSIDENLHTALEKYSTLSTHSAMITGGDDSADNIVKFKQAFADGVRIEKATERQHRFREEMFNFLDELLERISL